MQLKQGYRRNDQGIRGMSLQPTNRDGPSTQDGDTEISVQEHDYAMLVGGGIGCCFGRRILEGVQDPKYPLGQEWFSRGSRMTASPSRRMETACPGKRNSFGSRTAWLRPLRNNFATLYAALLDGLYPTTGSLRRGCDGGRPMVYTNIDHVSLHIEGSKP